MFMRRPDLFDLKIESEFVFQAYPQLTGDVTGVNAVESECLLEPVLPFGVIDYLSEQL